MIKLALFLATEKGYKSLERLINSGKASKIGCVVSFKEENVAHDWHGDIKNLCGANKILFLSWLEAKNNLSELFRKNKITSAIAISWRFLLPLEINNFLEIPLIVFHDSLLPKYRGFAPTPTAIINGEKFIGVTALFASQAADEGDIIIQRKIEVPHDKYMKEIINEQAFIYAGMLEEILSMIETGNICAYKQDENQASYSIWRNPEDCKINWNNSAEYIYNFIRALGEPYLGAYCYYNGEKIIIDKSEIISDKIFELRDAGKIWSIKNNMPEIICGSGMLRITQAHYEDGEKVKFLKLRARL